jgi:hypothetical protein
MIDINDEARGAVPFSLEDFRAEPLDDGVPIGHCRRIVALRQFRNVAGAVTRDARDGHGPRRRE